MRDIFTEMDAHGDMILKRSEFMRGLRTSERVVRFIDQPAVRREGQKDLTVEEVFREVERDETIEMAANAHTTDLINHKEFITWDEFMSYFEDFKESEERNRRRRELLRTRDIIRREREEEEALKRQPEVSLALYNGQEEDKGEVNAAEFLSQLGHKDLVMLWKKEQEYLKVINKISNPQSSP